MAHEVSPTARALLALEAIQNVPGITAQQLGDRLGVTERAARRYVAILREAGLPIDSVSGPYGGYQVGRGLRLPPLTFTAAEAAGLVMAVLEGHRPATDPADLVGGALAKIIRVLPTPVAPLVRSIRDVTGNPAGSAAPGSAAEHGESTPPAEARVSPALTSALIEACAAGRRVRLAYRLAPRWDGDDTPERPMEVDPWAVVLRHSRWYLLCWSHHRGARRVLRVDRIMSAEPMSLTFTPPPGLDALRILEEHLSQGWSFPVDVLIDAPPDEVAYWLPRSLGVLHAFGEGQTRLVASTDNPRWYAGRLAVLPHPFEITESAELRSAVAQLGRRLLAAAGDQHQDHTERVRLTPATLLLQVGAHRPVLWHAHAEGSRLPLSNLKPLHTGVAALIRNLTGLVYCSAAVLAMAAFTGCSPGGSSSLGTGHATVSGTVSGVAGSPGSSSGSAPSWAKSLGSGVTVTAPGVPAAGSPGAVLAAAIAAIEVGSYAKICGYLQPAQQSKCSSALGSVQASAAATAMPTFKNLTVSYTATDGTKALVGMTGTICSPDQQPSCVTNNDPAAVFDSGKTFSELWTESVTSTTSAYSLTPMIEIGGKWYGYSTGF